MLIRRVLPSDRDEWLRMRATLWPKCPAAEHLAEMDEYFTDAKVVLPKSNWDKTGLKLTETPAAPNGLIHFRKTGVQC